MIFRERLCDFPARRPVFAAALALLALSGCASATIEDAVPQGAMAGTAETALVEPGPGPVDTGEFPNLNIPRRGETQQLTGAERAEKAAELVAARKQTQQGQPATTDIGELRRLGSTHTADVLKEIESE